jgi:aminodeoxyfutalosine synthase
MLPEHLRRIEDKVRDGVRLSREEGIEFLHEPDIVSLGRIASTVKEHKSHNYAYFNVNRHINLTNICVSRCIFCAFSRNENETGAYVMSRDEVMEKAAEARELGVTEFHIVSGLHPVLSFRYYVDIVRNLAREFPDVHIKAFTAVEIVYFAKISGLSVREVLSELKNAGLGSLPGGGAEILSQRVRAAVCPHKATSEEWLNVMREAHVLGLRSNATILFGHIETPGERIDHLLALRTLQDETGGFQAFIPLPFHPHNTGLSGLSKPTALESLRMLAVSRLLLDNFEHIKAFWIMLGLKVAQLSLFFGVDDLDGTVVEERITHSAGAETEQSVSRKELADIIAETGRTPVERDTLYRPLKIYGEEETLTFET